MSALCQKRTLATTSAFSDILQAGRNPNGLERGTIRGNSNLSAGGPPQNPGRHAASRGVRHVRREADEREAAQPQSLQDDPQRTVIYRVGTLVVQNASHTQALGCSPNSRL